MANDFELQSIEFDALEAIIKDWREQPAIVDDWYPEWRHGFENKLHDFFVACMMNGRFDPKSRFGRELDQYLEQLDTGIAP